MWVVEVMVCPYDDKNIARTTYNKSMVMIEALDTFI